MERIAVLGAGSWGTALAILLLHNGHDVTLWSHRRSQIEEMRATKKSDKLSVELPEDLKLTCEMEDAARGKNLLVMAVPSVAERETAEKIRQYITNGQKIITVSKGIEEKTLLSQTDILKEVLKEANIGVLSGPSHAEEVVIGQPTLVVAGSEDKNLANYVQILFSNENFRVYTSDDVVGIEIGAALKNVLALAAGMSDGLGFGDNAKAALITRGIKEMRSLSVAMGGREETLNGLTGIGDLIVTCQSTHSRNRRAGVYIGQGMAPKEAFEKVQMVVEGAYSAKAARKLGEKFGMELPIVEKVNQVLFEGKDVKEAVLELMTRDLKAEFV